MTMRIRRRGRQVDEHFAMVPNETARDERLTLRARGVLLLLLSHRPGWSITTENVTAEAPEGRGAVRAAFTQLERFGYIRRVREQDERGRIVRWIDLYPYGDAEEASSEDADIPEVDEPDGPEEPQVTPETGFQSTENQRPENRSQEIRSPYRTPSTEDSTTSPDLVVGGGPQSDLTVQVSRDNPTDSPIPSLGIGPLPLVRRRQLMNAGVTETAGPQWELAWTTVTSMEWPEGLESEALNYPDEHLAQHVLQALERGHPLSPSRWVQFYIEDRQRQIGYAKARLEQEARLAEDPSEREARQNRHLPPDRSREFPPTGTTGVQG